MSMDEKLGAALRSLRVERSIPQRDFAQRLGVSPPYLSLLEQGKRAIRLPLLARAADALSLSVEDVMARAANASTYEGLSQLLDEPLLRSMNLRKTDLDRLGKEPQAAQTITALFQLYKNTRAELDRLLADMARRERQGDSELRFDFSPYDEVSDFLERRGNYFAAIEAEASALRKRHARSKQRGSADDFFENDLIDTGHLAKILRDEFEVDLESIRSDRDSVIRELDIDRGVLRIAHDLPEHRKNFQIAHAIGLCALDGRLMGDVLSTESLARHPFRHRETQALIKIHLANYFAGALLLPYEAFFREAQKHRYNAENLATLFQQSYETVAHRLCNLGDPKKRGVPLHFLRVDAAGNISKHVSSTGLHIPRGTGSCPKWAVHIAFSQSHAMTRQYSEFPDSSRFFCFAKVIAEPMRGSLARGTLYSIGVGTRADDAKFLDYADDMPFASPEKMSVKVGTSCRFCERPDCNQRAAPSYKFAFRVDERIKKDNFFSPMNTKNPSDLRKKNLPVLSPAKRTEK